MKRKQGRLRQLLLTLAEMQTLNAKGREVPQAVIDFMAGMVKSCPHCQKHLFGAEGQRDDKSISDELSRQIKRHDASREVV